MVTNVSIFSTSIIAEDWFDSDLQSFGWFDKDFLDTPPTTVSPAVFVSSTSAFDDGTVTSLVISKPTGLVSGNWMVMQAVLRPDQTLDTAALVTAGWTYIGVSTAGGTSGPAVYHLTRQITGSEPASYTLTFLIGSATAAILGFSSCTGFIAPAAATGGTAVTGVTSGDLYAINGSLIVTVAVANVGMTTFPAGVTQAEYHSLGKRLWVGYESIAADGVYGSKVFTGNSGRWTATAFEVLGTPTISWDSTGGFQAWSGSAWVQKPAKVWSGSGWVRKNVYRWNGSIWKKTNT